MRQLSVRSAALAGCIWLTACGPSEQWHNRSNPLGDAENTISEIVAGDGYILVFECSKKGLSLTFGTPEKQTWEQRPVNLSLLSNAPHYYSLQLRTDNEPVSTLKFRARWDSNNFLLYDLVTDDGNVDVIRSFMTAKTRIVVGAEPNVSGGKNHVKIFTAEGARNALSKSFAACNIDANSKS